MLNIKYREKGRWYAWLNLGEVMIMLKKIKNWLSPPVIVFRVTGGATDVKEFSNSDAAKHARKRFDMLIVNEAVTGIFFPKDGDNYGRK